jgi:hypothetical protein
MPRYDYYKKAKKYLQLQPKARSIDNRSKAVWNLVNIHILPRLETMDKDLFVKYFSKFQSFDRAIRAIQQDCPELRDSNDSKRYELEQQTIKELGY